jgi:hypothetical protein
MSEKEKINMVTLYLTEKSAAAKVETKAERLLPILSRGLYASIKTAENSLRSEGVPDDLLVHLVDGLLAESLVSLKEEFLPNSFWAKRWDVIEEMSNAWLVENAEEEANE